MKKIIYIILILLINTITIAEIPPDFKQADPRWGDYAYTASNNSKQTIKTTGCALAAAADIIAYWFDDTITPIELANLSLKKFHSCAYEGGTSSYFFYALAQEYPFTKFTATRHIDNAIKCLNEGGLVIVSFYRGIWIPPLTRGRHSCCIYNYSKEDGFRLHDPNAQEGIMSQIYGHTTYEKMKECAAMFYCYWN